MQPAVPYYAVLGARVGDLTKTSKSEVGQVMLLLSAPLHASDVTDTDGLRLSSTACDSGPCDGLAYFVATRGARSETDRTLLLVTDTRGIWTRDQAKSKSLAVAERAWTISGLCKCVDTDSLL